MLKKTGALLALAALAMAGFSDAVSARRESPLAARYANKSSSRSGNNRKCVTHRQKKAKAKAASKSRRINRGKK